ncbi:MAG TPA: glycosyltransferase [Xanthobacteraceae bacterium]|nr:glycosyltransferase [Xanthobacteraceae bacterium]
MSLSVMIAVTHLLGVGHLARAAALGRGLAGAGHRVLLASGGRPAPLVSAAGFKLVQLPAVHCRGTDFSTLLDDAGAPIDDTFRARRIAALLAALDEAAPDVLITETFPFGRRSLAAEFTALLEAAAALPRPPAVLASVRDILNPPARAARAAEAEAALGRHYEAVLVHGDGEVTPLPVSWPVSAAVERRLIYTGHIYDVAPTPPALGSDGTDEILVSGGGSAASLPLFEAALAAAALGEQNRRWRLLVGHGVAADAFAALAARSSAGVVVERARPDFAGLLARAAVSVSQAGYNTAVDLAVAGVRAVLVPFERGNEAEQRLRAERLAARGLAVLLPEADLTPRRLAEAVAQALAGPAPPAGALALDGVKRSIDAIEAAASRRRDAATAWARLDAALDAAGAQGGTVSLWWRDDDACEPSPALDRLLDLARRYLLPVALAVVPAAATRELAARLAEEPLASVLVHGWQHRNHAPPGSKKQELGYRPLPDIEAELSRALTILNSLFPHQAVACLVPPWNRIDPELLPRLEALGFIGLSTFGPRPQMPRHGLAVANTHLDPIDWRAGGGLAAEAPLVDRLAAHIEQVDAAPEPFGVLTHHLVHDAWTWRFIERLLERLAGNAAVRFTTAAEIFAGAAGCNIIGADMD